MIFPAARLDAGFRAGGLDEETLTAETEAPRCNSLSDLSQSVPRVSHGHHGSRRCARRAGRSFGPLPGLRAPAPVFRHHPRFPFASRCQTASPALPPRDEDERRRRKRKPRNKSKNPDEEKDITATASPMRRRARRNTPPPAPTKHH